MRIVWSMIDHFLNLDDRQKRPYIEKVKEILSRARLSKADEAELQQLETQIGSLPTAETPDDIKAMDIIRRAAQLLENS